MSKAQQELTKRTIVHQGSGAKIDSLMARDDLSERSESTPSTSGNPKMMNKIKAALHARKEKKKEKKAIKSLHPQIEKQLEHVRASANKDVKKKSKGKEEEIILEKPTRLNESEGYVSDKEEAYSSSSEETPDLSALKFEGFSLVEARKDVRGMRFTHPKKARSLEKSISKQAFDLPPDTSLTEEQIDNLVIRMIDPKTGIPIGIKKRNFKSYPNCFTGEEATKWLMNTLNVSRDQAVQLGQTMFMNRGIFYSITTKHSSFHDKSDVLYRFRILEQEDISVLNMSKLFVESITDAVKMSQELCDMAIKLLLIPHKRDNFKPVLKTRMYKKFVLSTSKLQKVQLERMPESDRRIFFINAHNILMVHSFILFGFPRVGSEYDTLMSKSYMIGNWPFSAKLMRDISIGHLAPHIPADMPRKLLDLPPDPLAHFCLFLGTNQAPSIRTYSREEFEEMSEQQAKQYIIDNVVIKKDTAEILLPKFFKTYQKDFGPNHNEFLRSLADYLGKSDRDWIRSNLKEIHLKYQEPTFENIQFIKESILPATPM